MNDLSFKVNGEWIQAERQPGCSLLKFLRDKLGLTGTKEGCGQGECGACTVLINGEAVNSCLVFLDSLEGADILTIEGLQKGEELDAVQKAFMECGAVQCGFCSPGMIMSVKGLLLKNPNPTEAEIRHAISGNLCRCTGYQKIVEAVRRACGEEIQPDKSLKFGFHEVGRNTARCDTYAKVTGRAIYADDIRIPGLLIAKAKRSPYSHAAIRSIELTEAQKIPGVVRILTADDIPGMDYFGQVYKDAPVICRDKVRMIGDPVAVVVAEDENSAQLALNKIRVEYEKLPVVEDAETAAADGAPNVHESGNVRQIFHVRKGNADQAFTGCAAVVEEVFHTALQEHAYLETECSVAYLDPETQKLTVFTPTQDVYSDRMHIAASLNLPEDEIRVIQSLTGGAFGGKIDVSTEIIAALASMLTFRPVKYKYDRRESIAVSTKRHPFRIHMKMGADAEGNVKAMKAEVLVDNGAYTSVGAKLVQKSCLNMAGPYRIDNVEIDSKLVYTNRPHGGAMRGFGIPQAAFAYESCIEELAALLGIDRIRMRRKNMVSVGDTTLSGAVLRTANAAECLEYIEEHYLKEAEAWKRGSVEPDIRRGIGIAGFVYPIGLGFGTKDYSTVKISLNPNGTVLVETGAADLGQGSDNMTARIVAEEIGSEEKYLIVRSADTANELFGGMSSGSRQTYVTGRAAMDAAKLIRTRLNAEAECLLGVSGERIEIAGHKILVDGKSADISYERLVSACCKDGKPCSESSTFDITTEPVPMENGAGVPFADFVYGAHLAEVEVDVRTGELKVQKIIAVHDVGCVINPVGLSGQIEGAVSMGYGQAVMEEIITDKGRLITPSLAEYLIPTSEDMPEVEFAALEMPSDAGPYGARGVAEPPVVGVGPSISSAIYDAIGIRVKELPITAERLKKAIEKKEGIHGSILCSEDGH